MNTLSAVTSVLFLLINSISYSQGSQKHDQIFLAKSERQLSIQKQSSQQNNQSRSVSQLLDSTIHQTWDTTANQMFNTSKNVYTYDLSKRVSTHSFFYWELASSLWDEERRYEYTYFENEDVAKVKTFSHIPSNSQVVNTVIVKYTYDNNHNVISEKSTSLNLATMQFSDTTKREYTYNANNQVTQFTHSYSISNAPYINYFKEESTYDVNSNRTLTVYFQWNSNLNQWGNKTKDENTYSANGNHILHMISNWDTTNNQWANNYKEENTFDVNGNTTLNLQFYWQTSLNQWQEHRKYEYTYDANDHNTLEIFKSWNYTTIQWNTQGKKETFYDVNGNDSSQTHYTMNASNQWITQGRFDYNFDNNYIYQELTHPNIIQSHNPTSFGYLYPYTHMLTNSTFDVWNSNTNAFQPESNYDYYYSPYGVNSITEINTVQLSVYPNPFTNQVTFNVANNQSTYIIELFDLHGRKVLTEETNNNEPINVAHLKNGLYMYSLIVDGETIKGKIIKQ